MAKSVNEKLYSVRIVVDKWSTHEVLSCLKSMGLPYAYDETGRIIILEEEKSLRALISKKLLLKEEQVSVITFLVPEAFGKSVVNYLTWKLDLDLPGKGSIIARHVTRLRAAEGLETGMPTLGPAEPKLIGENLIGIGCITVKGAGNQVASIGLTTGTAIPDFSYGIGTGLRNRLGAWRIFIPAEKEVANLVLAKEDADTIMDMMIEAGRLDHPGKGFIFQYPVAMGVLETKFSSGEAKQAASLEQIIYAIDGMEGNTAWRRKGLVHSTASDERSYIKSLVNYIIICNEGLCEGLTKAAMEAGASGSTMRRLKYVPLAASKDSISPAREISDMTIGESQVEAVTQALIENGLLEAAASGEVIMSPVPKAFTFMQKK